MRQPAYELDEQRRNIVLAAIREVCDFRNWTLLAAHARRTHVHVVVVAEAEAKAALDAFKAYSSRALNRTGMDAPGRRRWTRHGSTRYLWRREQVEAAVVYVADEQGAPTALYVNEDR